jgi:hypothetical protein
MNLKRPGFRRFTRLERKKETLLLFVADPLDFNVIVQVFSISYWADQRQNWSKKDSDSVEFDTLYFYWYYSSTSSIRQHECQC